MGRGIVAAVVLLLLLAAGLGIRTAVDARRPKGTDEEQIRQLLVDAEAAAERRDAAALSRFISEEYEDSLGMNAARLKFEIHDFLRRNQSLEIVVPSRWVQVSVEPDGRKATARLRVEALQQRADGSFAQQFDLSLGLAKERVHYYGIFPGEEWRVVRADGYWALE